MTKLLDFVHKTQTSVELPLYLLDLTLFRRRPNISNPPIFTVVSNWNMSVTGQTPTYKQTSAMSAFAAYLQTEAYPMLQSHLLRIVP